MITRVSFGTLALSLLGAAVALAQAPPAPFSGSLVSGQPTQDALPLTLPEAIDRGLAHNLGLISIEDQVESARGARLRSLRELLPRLEHLELAGECRYVLATFVGGPKNVPIRYRMRQRAAAA